MRDMLCSKCGKNFVPAAQHLYRDEENFYCSWTCFNHKDDRVHTKKLKPVEMLSTSGILIKEFASVKEAAQKTDFEMEKIQQACKVGGYYFGYVWRYKK